METESKYDDGESDEQTAAMDYPAAFANSTSFKASIQTKLTSTGSVLSPNDLVIRAQTQTCAGCHQLSVGAQLGGGVGSWPATLGFTHEKLAMPEPNGPDGPRYQISDALKCVFLPFRKHVIETFLQSLHVQEKIEGCAGN
jgi:hypothetical protein